ncbi:MAG TPA: GNAT family N-acetyltransferase [Burkholderiales bacterium]|nr:GNAT family N-acetyltransferase [Burkholderiales bacterium]
MNAESLSIRQATRADVPLVLSFVKELAEYERLSHLVEATEEVIAEELFGPKSRTEVLLAYCGAEPVAFAVYFHNFSTFLGRKGLYLEDLYVRPAHRRRGFGRAMLLRVARIAAERNCGRLEWSVLDWNEPAIFFYETLGATIMHEWKLVRVTGSALEKLARMK